MSNNENLLITISNGEYLIKVAIKISQNMVIGDALKYPLEPENKAQFAKLLPKHCRSFGNIVEVEEIFEVKDFIK